MWLTIYAVAMAYVESAVVVYLRALYYPHGFDFPLAPMPAAMAAIEIGREAATLIMLLGVAALTSADRWEWFLAFCVSFGVWDIFYYAWLWVLVRWPPSLFTRDLLFLIPVPWIGPVLAPVLVSGALVAASLRLLRLKAQGVRLGFSAQVWTMAVTGGLVVVGSFVIDFASVVRQEVPPPFHWGVFAIGVALAATALVLGVSRLDQVQDPVKAREAVDHRPVRGAAERRAFQRGSPESPVSVSDER
jgi:hypothetical protein